tara:strand:+ start:45 stop:440 length:396 start_codon:yes stop_codon:yes gene_type:complete
MSTKQKEGSKVISKRTAKLKEDKLMKDFAKATKSIHSKKEGMPKEIAMMQFEEATSPKNVGKGLDKKFIKGDMSSIKKIADAAADKNQLASTERKMFRDLLKGGGRAMYKSGMRVCKLAKRGKGRAYGKNS